MRDVTTEPIVPPPPRPHLAAPLWYHDGWTMLLATLMVPPVGAFLIATSPVLTRKARVGLLLGLTVGAVALGVQEWRTGLLSREVARGLAYRSALKAGEIEEDPAQASQAAALYRTAYEFAPFDLSHGQKAALLSRDAGEARAASAFLLGLLEPPRRDVPRAVLIDLIDVELSDPAQATRGADRALAAAQDGRLDRTHPRGLMMVGLAHLTQGRLDEAESTLRGVVATFRRDYYERTYLALSEVARRRGKLDQALTTACEAVKVGSSRPQTIARMEEAAQALGLETAPYRCYARALEMEDRWRALDASTALLEKLAHRDSFRFRDGALYSLATIQFHRRREFTAALANYKAIIERFPLSESWLRSHYQLGQTYERLGRDRDAFDAYKILVTQAPSGTALNQMARVQLERLKRLGRW